MIFFIYSSLLFNKSLSKQPDYDMMRILFYISLTSLTAFSIFFINYAHSAFTKSRNKEFGVYLTLGMNSNELRKLVALENVIIMMSAFSAGIISGTLFSRLFQMVVLKLLDIKNVTYSLDYKSFALTIFVFAVIFASVALLSSLQMRGLDIADLIKESQKNEGKSTAKVLPGIIGVILIGLSLVLLVTITKNEKLRSQVPVVVLYIALTFTGVYLTISYIGSAVMGYIKNSNFYFKNILSLTEINHKFNQNKKIIFILSVLSSMTVTLVASPFSLYSLAGNIAEMNRKNNIEYVQLGDINKLSKDQYNNILTSSDTSLQNTSNTEFISLELQGDSDKEDILKSKPIVSEDTYNAATGLKVHLEKGEALNVITSWTPGYHNIFPKAIVSFSDGTKTYTFSIKDSMHSTWVGTADTYISSSGIVISNEDYKEIKGNISPQNIGIYRGITFNEWKKTSSVVDNLTNALKHKNASLKNGESQFFIVSSTVKFYEELKRKYSFFIFVTTIMGFLFFIAGGSVLFFKQYTELNSDRARFLKLYKIGISEEEAVRVISKELRVTFFTPLVIGSFLGYSFIYLLTFIFSGGDIINKFILNATFVVVIYFLFQAVFYGITKWKYVNEVIKQL